MATTLERIERALAGLTFQSVKPRDGMPCVEVGRGALHAVCARLRDRCGFETNTFVTAVDRFPAEPRFELVYQFLSIEHGDRVRVRVKLPSQAAHVPTITDLWPGSAYSERECYDMFGVVFDDHAGLKRLLMPEDYDHFPLRKDFPHQGIEPDLLYRRWDAARRTRADPEHVDASQRRVDENPERTRAIDAERTR